MAGCVGNSAKNILVPSSNTEKPAAATERLLNSFHLTHAWCQALTVHVWCAPRILVRVGVSNCREGRSKKYVRARENVY